jgi:hypothetical protein
MWIAKPCILEAQLFNTYIHFFHEYFDILFMVPARVYETASPVSKAESCIIAAW